MDRRPRPIRFLAPVVLAATAALGAVTTIPAVPVAGAAPAPTGPPVRIGLEAPLTGDQAALGQGMLFGARLAADRANARGGFGGRPVEIVPIDDQADPTVGVAAATAAIASGLDGVVGPYNSGVGVQTLPLYLAAGIEPVRLTSAEATSGLGVTLQPMTGQIAPVASKALVTWLKAKKVAIAYDNSTIYTQSVAAALQDDLTRSGAEVTAYAPFEPGGTNYRPLVEKLLATSPDVVYFAAYYPEGALMAQAMVDDGGKTRCVADYASYDQGYIQVAGPRAQRRCTVVGVPAPDEFSGSAKYVKAYRKQFSQEPGSWSPYTFDSVGILLAAAEKAGGFSATALAQALRSISYSGWTGPVDLEPSTGDREPATVVVTDVDAKMGFRIDPAWAKAVGAKF